MNKRTSPPSTDRSGLRYLGLATQLMASLVVAVWLGYRLDKYWGLFPGLTAIFPLIVLIAIFYKIVRETRK